MDDAHSQAESHNLKFIIPRVSRPAQPGLEVTRYAEDDVTSPQVVQESSDLTSNTSAASPFLSSQGSQYRQHTRGISASSNNLPQRAEYAASQSRSPVSRLPGSRDSQAPIALGDDSSQPEVAIKRHIQDFKFEEPPPLQQSRKKLILGLPVLWFWILVAALVVVLAIGLAVGLAVGLSNSKQGAGSTTSPTANSTGYSTPTDQGTQGLSSPAPVNDYCPSQNGSVVTPYDASGSIIRFNNESPQSFTLLCNTYYPAKAGTNDRVRDILVVFTPDLYACMQLCAQYNAGYSDAVGDDVSVGGGICVSAALEKVPGGFCHLQNATGVNDTSAAGGGREDTVDTALLVGNWSSLDSGDLTAVFGGNLGG